MASGWARAVTTLGSDVLLWGGILFALLVGSFYGLLIIPLGMLALAALVNRIFPLVAIDAGLTKARRRAVRGLLAAMTLALVVAAVDGLL